MDYRLVDVDAKPTEDVDIREVFGIQSDMKIKAFAETTDRVPLADPTYKFDPETTLAILCLLYTSPSPRDLSTSRMPSSA